jgi:hypothetical protein
MAQNKKSPAKKKRPAITAKATRRLKGTHYKTFRLQKRIKHPKPKIKGAFRIFSGSLKLLVNNWKLFGGIVLVYIILDVLLVKGLHSTSGIPQLKESLSSLLTGVTAQVTTGFSAFSLLLGSAGNAPTPISGAYQSMLLVLTSLVLIWALRQVTAKEKASARDAFYKGTYPLVQFLVVLLVIFLQLVPLAIGNFLYKIVFSQGIAVTSPEKVLWAVLLFLLAILSLYMASSSIFALYIVTLPDMRPMQALRSARELVRYRRWAVMRKVIFLPFILLVLSAVITIPFILFVTVAAEWIFFVLTMIALPVIHSYMYSLYRELL